MNSDKIKQILEGAIMASGNPINVDGLTRLFDKKDRPSGKDCRNFLKEIADDYSARGVELKEVGSGYRFQVRSDLSEWMSKLWEEKPPRYSRALLETLSLIAYRQPITRAEIENVRGVVVSTNIMRTLLEREWVKVVGHKDVPGKPALYATTKMFLDYFNLKTITELPELSDLRDIDGMAVQLDLEVDGESSSQTATTDSELAELTTSKAEDDVELNELPDSN